MIEGSHMIVLAHADANFGVAYLAMFVWIIACFVGLIGLILSFFRACRRLAIAVAYVTIGLVALFVAWFLTNHHWSDNWDGDWIPVVVFVLFMAMPCGLGMALIMYHRQKERPPK